MTAVTGLLASARRWRFSLVLALLLTGCPAARTSYVPRDRTLRSLPLYFYPASGKARAVLVFLGNDVGFWAAHEELARRLSSGGVDVIGLDVRKYLERLPAPYPAREAAFRDSIGSIIRRSVIELHAGALPLILGGHSFGADLALWTAVHVAPRRTVGVLALGPTGRSHFYVTAFDRANVGEPDEAGSFSIEGLIRDTPANMRIALLRGSKDRRIALDSGFQAAGGTRLRYTVIPFASHSLRSLTIAGPMTGRALEWILGRN